MKRGFKAFNLNMTCRGKQYCLNEQAVHEGQVVMCESGIHYCQELANVFNYYDSGIYCEVTIPDDAMVITEEIGRASCRERV